MDKLFLGIDLGTSCVKTVLWNPESNIIQVASCNYPSILPSSLKVEQNPDDWYWALKTSIKLLLNKSDINIQRLEGISITGQMHGLVLVDEEGNFIRNAIIWSDQRSKCQVTDFYNGFGANNYIKITGNPLSSGFTLPSWLWIMENEKDISKNTFKILLPKDYLRFKLTRTYYSDPSDAVSTGLFDVNECVWSQAILDFINSKNELLPEVKGSFFNAGKLKEDVAKDLGLSPAINVYIGGGDTPVQAFGQGIDSKGTLSIGISSGGNIIGLSDKPIIDSKGRVHCMNYLFPNSWYSMGAIMSAGDSMEWFRQNFFPHLQTKDLIKIASKAGLSPKLFFLPHINGERTPYMDPEATGMFLGLSMDNHLGDIVRSIMEGVCFSLRICFDILIDIGIEFNTMIASGGGTKSDFWMQLLTDTLNFPITKSDMENSSAFGAAMIAAIGSGSITKEDIKNSMRNHSKKTFFPNKEMAKYYQKKYERFIEIYPLWNQTSNESH